MLHTGVFTAVIHLLADFAKKMKNEITTLL